MQDDAHRVHEFRFEGFYSHLLAHCQVVLIDHLDCDMDRFTSLLEFDAHLVDTIDDALAPLFNLEQL